MTSNQRNNWSKRRGARAPNVSSLPATPTPNRLGQWRQNYERYKVLAESAGNTDSVTREGYWQNAEHFIRLINEAQGRPSELIV
jgi:hypothetical protein